MFFSGFHCLWYFSYMKYLVRIFCVLCAFSQLRALPVGNTAAPQILREGFFIPEDSWIDVRVGYEGDFVADARLKQTGGGKGRVDDDSQSTNSGTVTINLLDRVDIYSVLGSSRTCAKWRFLDGAGEIHQVQLETFHDLLWAVGARAILFAWESCDLGCGGRYSAANHYPSWLTIDGVNRSEERPCRERV